MGVIGWTLLTVAVLIAALVLGIAILLAKIATARVLFQSRKETPTPWDAYREAAQREIKWFQAQQPEDVQIISADGLTLRGRYLAAEGSKSAIVLMHGYRAVNGENDFAPLLRFYHELGLSMLVVDQRAHGASEGSYICYGVKERYDLKQWLEWLAERSGAENLYAGGLSMGAATVLMATALPLPKQVRGVIADCGFTSPWDICAHVLKDMYHMPLWPFLPLANRIVRRRAGVDLREASAMEAMQINKHMPVLFIHGGADGFVPTWMGRMNYEACQSEKRLVIVPDAGHGLSAWRDGERVTAEIADFLKTNRSLSK